MKITLATEILETLQADHADLTVALAEYDAAVTQAKQADGKLIALESEVSRLRQDLDVLDAQAVREISVTERQRDLLAEQMGTNHLLSNQKRDVVVRKARAAAARLAGALGDYAKSVAEEIAQGIAPFYRDIDRARLAARQTDMMIQYGAGLRLLSGQYIEAIDGARNLEAQLKAAMQGENPFWGVA